ALCEPADSRNPDSVVGALLPLGERLACLLQGALHRRRLRADPFYHYLVARTRHFDQLFLEAVRDSVACIINIGCGSDTRAYRFQHLLRQKGVSILECDQPRAIQAKQRIAQRHWRTDHIRYVPLELHDTGWTSLVRLLDEKSQGPVLVMMEGVSPYVSSRSFEAFLRVLAAKLHPGSLLAYDFKIVGTMEEFGRS